MYSVILVEDNIEERNILKKMLLSISEFIKIYEADSEATALNIIQNNDINMFLIDINLKQSSGLDLAMKIRSISKYEFRQIIFLTTHMAYITQAFKKTHCYDYILKPYDHKEVQVMLNKLILNESSYKDKVEEKELVITLKSGIYVGIKIREIIFIEVIGKNCEVNTINGLYIANNMSLKKIMKLIDCDDIIQSHRSFAVNKDYISKIEKIDIKLSAVYFNNSSKTCTFRI